jgi:hypothetical protein
MWRLGLAAVAERVGKYAAGSDFQSPVVERVEVTLAKLPAELEGLTIAQLSDLHWGPFVGHYDVRRAVDLALSLQVDLIVLTGDFVSRSARYESSWSAELSRLRAPLGVYAVLGNHDVWVDADAVAYDLERVGVTVLRDTCKALHVNGARLWLLGIEDGGVTCGLLRSRFRAFKAMQQEVKETLDVLLTDLPADELRILLLHNPDFVELLPEERLDLILCGHTHGGQILLPFVGAPLVPLCLGREYVAGLIRHGSAWVYVNRGVGVGWLPLRLNCPPEVTCLRLRTYPESPARGS